MGLPGGQCIKPLERLLLRLGGDGPRASRTFAGIILVGSICSTTGEKGARNPECLIGDRFHWRQRQDFQDATPPSLDPWERMMCSGISRVEQETDHLGVCFDIPLLRCFNVGGKHGRRRLEGSNQICSTENLRDRLDCLTEGRTAEMSRESVEDCFSRLGLGGGSEPTSEKNGKWDKEKGWAKGKIIGIPRGRIANICFTR